MRKIIKIFFFALIIFSANCTAYELLNKIVAVVNNEVITQDDLTSAINSAKNQLKSNKIPIPPYNVLKNQVMNNLINIKLEEQLAKNANITISDSDLNAAILQVAQSNGMTLDQLKSAIESNGTSFSAYREKFKEQMKISQLQQMAVAQNITVTKEEINTFLRRYKNTRSASSEYHLEDILIPIPNNPTPAQTNGAQKKAEQLVQQLQEGGDFQKLAASFSRGSQAFNGGDLGWRELAQMPNIFSDKVKNMKTGEVAGPLKAPNGFHIIKLLGVKNAHKLNKKEIENMIYRRKFEEQLQIWIQKIRSRAYIKIM